MRPATLFREYIWLVSTIRRAGELTATPEHTDFEPTLRPTADFITPSRCSRPNGLLWPPRGMNKSLCNMSKNACSLFACPCTSRSSQAVRKEAIP